MASHRLMRPLVVWGVWLASAAAAWWLYQDLGGLAEAPGEAEVRTIRVGPTVPGRVASVLVEPGDRVVSGQVLADLDDSVIRAEIREAEAELRRLQGLVSSRKIRFEASTLDRARGMSSEARDAAQRLTSARTALAADRAELEGLEREVALHEAMVEQGMATSQDLAALRRRRGVLLKRIEGREELVKELEARVLEARARVQRWRGLLSSGAGATEEILAPERAAVEAARARVERLEARRAEMRLVAPVTGTVTRVLEWPGAAVAAGEPVVELQEPWAHRVVVYLDEQAARRVAVGQRVVMRPRDRRGPAVSGRVVALEPGISEFPPRFRKISKLPQWGRRAYVLPDQERLIPGIAFDVGFGEVPERPIVSGPAPGPGAMGLHEPEGRAGSGGGVAQGPLPMKLPPTLTAKTRFEPSGIEWIPQWGRFLVVSDDTGLGGSDEHHPWVFTMDERGRVDPSPVVVQGLDEVSDLESAALWRGDHVFLLASQSASRKGNRPVERELLVLARILPGPALRLDAATPLLPAVVRAAGLTPEPGPWLRGLGLTEPLPRLRKPGPDGTDLLIDLEGLAATEGGLLVGLKEPLAEDGSAIVWKLERPEELVRTGALAPDRIGVWRDLTLVHPESRAPMGVSGLHVDGAGGLWITSTVPGGGQGALWRWPNPSKGPARLVAAWTNLKPEGVCPHPQGWVAVVFDTGDSGRPLWAMFPATTGVAAPGGIGP